jgi:mannosyl-oligosaccharide alpha-1,2-mannosidase
LPSKNADLKAIDGVLENMLFLSPTRQLLYVTDIKYGHVTNKLEHLSCFFPGLLALGVKTLSLPPKVAQLHKWAAEGLATTCYLMYADQPSGLGAEAVTFEKWGAVGAAAVYDNPSNSDPTPVPGQNGTVRGSIKNRVQGRWMDAVRLWEAQGKVGDVPPGVRGGTPVITGEGVRKDYGLWDNRYLLRPEVCFSRAGSVLVHRVAYHS